MLQWASSSNMCHRQRHVGCRLEILKRILTRQQMNLQVWICSQKGSVRLSTGKWHYGGCIMAKTNIYMHIWLGGVLAICIKQVFSYNFHKPFWSLIGTTDRNQWTKNKLRSATDRNQGNLLPLFTHQNFIMKLAWWDSPSVPRPAAQIVHNRGHG